MVPDPIARNELTCAFLMEHWLDLLVLLVLCVGLIVLWAKGKKAWVIHIIQVLVARAEQEFGSGTGAIKLATVWDGIYERMPWTIQMMFPKAVLAKYIEDAVKWLQNKLDEADANLLSYADEAFLYADAYHLA